MNLIDQYQELQVYRTYRMSRKLIDKVIVEYLSPTLITDKGMLFVARIHDS